MDLETLRKEITSIDTEIVKLISDRSKITIKIAEKKKETNAPIYQPSREKEVFTYLSSINKGPLSNEHLHNIYKEIMSAAKSLQRNFSIAYLGPEGSFTHQATIKKFGHSLSLISQANISAVFAAVESGECMYGVVPFENSIEGKVIETLDMFVDTSLNIFSEIKLSIHHNLITNAKNIDDITKIYTHRQAKAQCQNWLRKYIPNAEWYETTSTSKAVEFIKNNPDCSNIAAIGSVLASETYNIPILKKSIEDYKNNYTRFVTISKNTTPISKMDKTSILVTLPHNPGSLSSILNHLSKANINLTSIESRPDHRKIWNYLFFIDIEGHSDNELVLNTLNTIKKEATHYKLLGSYPIDEIEDLV